MSACLYLLGPCHIRWVLVGSCPFCLCLLSTFPICLHLLDANPHLPLPVGSPSVSASWVHVTIYLCLLECVPPICLSMADMSLCPLLPVGYESLPASSVCWVHVPICLCLLDVYSSHLLPVGCMAPCIPACWARGLSYPSVGCAPSSVFTCRVPASACWVSLLICLNMSGPCVCLLGTCLLLSSWLGMGLSLCRPTGRMGGRARGQPSGDGEGGRRERKGTW